jgi:1-phosphofructokinase family hexose kinase
MEATAAPRSLAVATNPAVDRVARLGGPAAGVVRATEILETPGGKATHVMMVARQLGAEVELLATVGGRGGEQFVELLIAEELPVQPVPVAAAMRGTYTLVVDGEGDVVEVHEPGEPWAESDADKLVAAVERLAPGFGAVAICGSLPAGAPVDLHARLVAAARAGGARAILDCSTVDAFAAALEASPDLVAPNLDEARALSGAGPMLTGRKLQDDLSFRPTNAEVRPGDAELLGLCDGLIEAGAGAVWLSLGAGGSLLATPELAVRLRGPEPGAVVNAVGCGDALIGGLLAGLAEGDSLPAAAALGVAAATDKLSHLHPGKIDAERVRVLATQVEATPLRGEVVT